MPEIINLFELYLVVTQRDEDNLRKGYTFRIEELLETKQNAE